MRTKKSRTYLWINKEGPINLGVNPKRWGLLCVDSGLSLSILVARVKPTGEGTCKIVPIGDSMESAPHSHRKKQINYFILVKDNHLRLQSNSVKTVLFAVHAYSSRCSIKK